MAFKNFDSMVFETGTATTDGSGEVTVTLDCFKESITPCIVVTPYGSTGNSVACLTDVQLSAGLWTAKIITTSPNISVRYHAFATTTGTLTAQTGLITQNLFNILTQNGAVILPQ